MIFEIIAMLMTGVLAGGLSGLFGLGGGVVVVPILYVFFVHLGIPSFIIMHLAIGTSLAAMITTTAQSIYHHYQKNNIDWNLVHWLSPYVAIGAILGSIIAHFIHSNILRYFFMVLLLYVIVNSLLKKSFREKYELKDFKFPKTIFSRIFFSLVGFISVLLGVGGSLFSVPYFRQFHCPMKNASATAVALTPAVSILGAVGYLLMGLHSGLNIPNVTGYVYWPAFFGIALGSLIGVPIGAKLSHTLPDGYQAKLYIVLLIIFLAMVIY